MNILIAIIDRKASPASFLLRDVSTKCIYGTWRQSNSCIVQGFYTNPCIVGLCIFTNNIRCIDFS